MDDSEAPLLRSGGHHDAASALARESLDRYSQDELAERLLLLEAEIARVKAHREKSAAHRLAAEAFFKPKGGGADPA